MGCDGNCSLMGCDWPAIPWEKTGLAAVGPCDDAMLRQCDVAWPSDVANLTAGAPTANLTWTVTEVGFTELYPVAMKFSSTPDDGADREEFGRIWGASAIRYQNTNYMPQNETTPIVMPSSLFEPYCNRALRISELGKIKAGANSPIVAINLLATTFAGQVNATGVIFARSIRGSEGSDYKSTP